MRVIGVIPLIVLSLVNAVSGCKVVRNPSPEAKNAAQTDQSDEARMANYAQEIWEPKVLPAVQENLVPLLELRKILDQDIEKAGNAHGLRPEGEANLWNFAVSGTGKIIEAKTKSKAAKLQVDTDADGIADVTVQLGPIIRGTAFRDAMPFINFSDFRDQIEYAKLARAMNDLAHRGITIPEGDVVGQTVTFEGVYTLNNPTDKPEIVPVSVIYGAQ
ncbi:hypothetical protein GCM10008927_06280 [Amylibacter ulvae]|uniref:Periplasmic lipoprotein n=1 Tax=Paramylibacter ulvae TaxID=1651968 RepID=A0ABQ3CW98_9RHOB|nr:DUF2291 domain-containing protein [Amylibacter ulvae]GHA44249.1 hypothetical protein GCM10008927_06280 [Amylibacter ulvae]